MKPPVALDRVAFAINPIFWDDVSKDLSAIYAIHNGGKVRESLFPRASPRCFFFFAGYNFYSPITYAHIHTHKVSLSPMDFQYSAESTLIVAKVSASRYHAVVNILSYFENCLRYRMEYFIV